jgi:hypothetical protein
MKRICRKRKPSPRVTLHRDIGDGGLVKVSGKRKWHDVENQHALQKHRRLKRNRRKNWMCVCAV